MWGFSVGLIIITFGIFGGNGFLSLVASLIGVTSILLNAKGNPIGQILMLLFCLLYGFISYSFSYYGEMITYLGMSMPMAVFSLGVWLKHPYSEDCSEVQVNSLMKMEIFIMFVSAIIITIFFYWILDYFHTVNIIPSTISVMTSFLAVYLTFRRSAYFSLAYSVNDIVLIVLWTLASLYDERYIAVVVCFLTFFINDVYGFISWKKMKAKQCERIFLK